ncbi:hypothetical protein PR202_ga22233 [Eleusine coracana subsp. coracana]|uniref:PIR2-like helical domain-containing protein n=1 Tax=Eleusine coracana subsp. coracana TaxID=191504 RepID=A0AAV5D2U2_ELECO|nr:hypothetical protein PR202_ga22233 [Eleusine coracana subsp. coracana]
MAQRSLDAFVAFLVSYFCYLPTSEALRYLHAAKADLLVAVRLVEMDRCTCAFDVGSPTARTALRCAALAAGFVSSDPDPDPDPEKLVSSTLSLASQAGKVSKILSSYPDRLCVAAIEQLRNLLVQGNPQCVNSRELMMFAASRLHPHRSDSPQFSTLKDIVTPTRRTQSLQRVLLDRIHGFYLEALALLPRDELRHHYHRSLVKAGHLYGPFDPVSNIIVTTIWYCATYPWPEEQQFESDMIGRRALIRAERRFLAGLVSGLRAFFGGNHLSDLDAICHHLHANANLGSAVEALQLTCLKDQVYSGHPPSACRMPSDLYRIIHNNKNGL